MIKLPSIFKQTPNKKYHYTPRYYDERKERIEELEKRSSLKGDKQYYTKYKRKSFREDWYRQAKTKNVTKSNQRLFLIIILLIVIAYIIIKKYNIVERLF